MPTTCVVGIIRKGQTNRNEWSCGKMLKETAWEEGWTNRQKTQVLVLVTHIQCLSFLIFKMELVTAMPRCPEYLKDYTR